MDPYSLLLNHLFLINLIPKMFVCKAIHCFFDALVKFLKSIISSVISVCPSVRMEQLGSHRKDFHEI